MTVSFARAMNLLVVALCTITLAACAVNGQVYLPRYSGPYAPPTTQKITQQLVAIRECIEQRMPLSVATRPSARSPQRFGPMHYTLLGYPSGVIYSGMLAAGEATGDKAFTDFDTFRFEVLADELREIDLKKIDHYRGPLLPLIGPRNLDDCGAIGAALAEARRKGVGPDLSLPIDRIAKFISENQLRLDDGTLARPRPFRNSLWADDSYMSVPMLAQMGAMTGEKKYFDDAATQLLQLSKYLFVPSTGLYTHHWNAGNPDNQPKYYWGRANGWCIVALVDLLEVLPADHPKREELMKLLRAHAQALATCQAGDGLWHQMLDRPDSYTETSCSAMFTFALARAVNRGWLDSGAYGPVAQAGWNGISTRIAEDGSITGTCVGTSYADDYVYYYNRPSEDDIHGYGATLLAGAEMIHLINNPNLKITGNVRSPTTYLNRSTTQQSPEQ